MPSKPILATCEDIRALKEEVEKMGGQELKSCAGVTHEKGAVVPSCKDMEEKISTAIAGIPKPRDTCADIKAFTKVSSVEGANFVIQTPDGKCGLFKVPEMAGFTDVRLGMRADRTSIYEEIPTALTLQISNAGPNDAKIARVTLNVPESTASMPYQIGEALITKPQGSKVHKVNALTYDIKDLGKGKTVLVKYPLIFEVKGSYTFMGALSRLNEQGVDFDASDDMASLTFVVSSKVQEEPSDIECPAVKLGYEGIKVKVKSTSQEVSDSISGVGAARGLPAFLTELRRGAEGIDPIVVELGTTVRIKAPENSIYKVLSGEGTIYASSTIKKGDTYYEVGNGLGIEFSVDTTKLRGVEVEREGEYINIKAEKTPPKKGMLSSLIVFLAIKIGPKCRWQYSQIAFLPKYDYIPTEIEFSNGAPPYTIVREPKGEKVTFVDGEKGLVPEWRGGVGERVIADIRVASGSSYNFSVSVTGADPESKVTEIMGPIGIQDLGNDKYGVIISNPTASNSITVGPLKFEVYDSADGDD